MSPDLLEEIVAHIDRLRRADQPTGSDAYLFPNRKGRRMTRQRAAEIVRDAATLASTRLAARDLPELPNTSHTRSDGPISRSRSSPTASTCSG